MRTVLCFVVGLLACLPPLSAQETTESSPRFTIPETDQGLPGAGPIRRYDWMKHVWNQRRSTFADNAQANHGAVVFLGDSITQGWGDDFRGDFGKLKVANRGISGDTTRGMLIRLEQDVLNLDPAAVVMLMGTNDLEEDAKANTIAGNVELILKRLQQHNAEMPIVLCLVMPSSESKDRSAEQIKELNQRLAEAVRGNEQVTLVDTWTLFANEQGDAKPEEFPDLLHPNEQGYQKWKKALIPVFATLGLTATEPDSFTPEAGFVSLFNGHDLTGWGYRVTPDSMRRARAGWLKNAPAVDWPLVDEARTFDGEKSTPDGRFVAINGRLVVTTPSEGRRIQQLWTTREFPQDFVLRLEFRATPNADSGVFLRLPQLQCRDYTLAGPYKDLKKYRAQQWNALEVTVKDNVAIALATVKCWSRRCSCQPRGRSVWRVIADRLSTVGFGSRPRRDSKPVARILPCSGATAGPSCKLDGPLARSQ